VSFAELYKLLLLHFHGEKTHWGVRIVMQTCIQTSFKLFTNSNQPNIKRRLKYNELIPLKVISCAVYPQTSKNCPIMFNMDPKNPQFSNIIQIQIINNVIYSFLVNVPPKLLSSSIISTSVSKFRNWVNFCDNKLPYHISS
jgi:hypothetical protein